MIAGPEVSAAPSGESTPLSRLGVLVAKAAGARVPLSGSFALTHRCNLRCVHCYLGAERHASSDSAGEADTGFWLDLLDQLAAAGCLNLLITGGEPLLRPDFPDIYTRARRLGLLVSVFTNATLIDDKTLGPFLEHPPDLVEVTLYGATEEVFDEVTGVRGSWRRCLKGIDSLARAGIRVGLKSMILKENRHEIPAMRTMAQERGVNYRLDPSLFACRDGHRGPLDHRIPAEEAVAIEMADERFRRRAAAVYRRMRGAPPEQRLYACQAARTGFHVDPAGLLLPCLMLDSPRFDLRRGRFLSGWREVLPRLFHQSVAPGDECHHCEKRSICGFCPAQFRMESGSVHLKSEYICRLGTERHRVLADMPVADDVAPGANRN